MNTDNPRNLLTSDYDGHTPAPWELIERCCDYQRKDRIVAGQIIADNCDPINSTLIAAAPDLLAEVKRLRELTDRWDCTCGMTYKTKAEADEHRCHDDLLAEVKRLRGLCTDVWKAANQCGEEPIDMDETLSAICRLVSKEEMK
jgi:hypothetical protein